jgi:phospholipid/cholesterol/gamma-HCH transport system substrate-binding protein
MEGDRRLSLAVGGLALAALAALALVILSLSAEQGVFASRYRLIARFANVQGLLPGAPVWLAGKRIGRVESVEFSPAEAGLPPITVELQVDETMRERLRSDSVASIGTIGVLGDVYVELSPGTTASPLLGDGGELHTLEPANLNQLISKASAIAGDASAALDSIASLATNLDATVAAFDAGQGGVKLAGALVSVSDIVGEIRDGDGLLHSLIYDEYQGGGVKSIERSLASLESIIEEVRGGEGILHTLIYGDLSEQDVIHETLEAGARMNNILAKVDRGEGTLGLLLNDPTLYEDLKLLVSGAKRSLLVRSMVELMMDEGREAQER